MMDSIEEDSRPNVVVLTDEKVSFSRHRYLQTLLSGGRYLADNKQPKILYIVQIILYILPLLIVVPCSIAIFFMKWNFVWSTPTFCVIAGVTMMLIVTIIHLVSFFAKRTIKKRVAVDEEDDKVESDVEKEEQVGEKDEKSEGSKTNKPKKKKAAAKDSILYIIPYEGGWSTLLRILMTGMLTTLAVFSITHVTLAKIQALEYVFGVVILLIYLYVQYPMTMFIPAELNQYHEVSDAFRACFRSTYFTLFGILDIVFYYTTMNILQYINYGWILLVPLGLITGIFPQPNLLIYYEMEFLSVHLFGGTPRSSTQRTIVSFIWEGLGFVMVALLWVYVSQAIAVGCAAAWALMLCNNIIVDVLTKVMNRMKFLVRQVWHRHQNQSYVAKLNEDQRKVIEERDIVEKETKEKTIYVYGETPDMDLEASDTYVNKQMYLLKQDWIHIVIWGVATLIGICLFVGVGVLFHYVSMSLTESQVNISIYVLLGVNALLALLNLTLPFFHRAMFFGCIKNPLYHALFAKQHVKTPFSVVFGYICQGLAVISIIAHVGTWMAIGMIMHIFTNNTLATWQCILSFFYMRSFRYGFTDIQFAQLETILALIGGSSSIVVFPYMPLIACSFGFLFKRCSFLLARFHYLTTYFYKVVSDTKHQFKHYKMVLVLNLILAPLGLCILFIATILGAPYLPLLGLPLFILGYPRLLKTWPHNGQAISKSADSLLYERLKPSILSYLRAQLGHGFLIHARPGDIFMMRSEYYIIWIELLEKSFGYARFGIKGLELQTTSCHALEATKLDEMIENVFMDKKMFKTPFLHTFAPVQQTQLSGFSTSSITLRGVMTSNDTFNALYSTFSRALIWHIVLSHASQFNDVEGILKLLPYSKAALDEELVMWPESWYESVLKFAENPDSLKQKLAAKQKMEADEERREEEARIAAIEKEEAKKKPDIPSIENHIQGSTTIVTTMEGFGVDSSSDEEEVSLEPTTKTAVIEPNMNDVNDNEEEEVPTQSIPSKKNESLETATRYFVCACIKKLRELSRAWQFDHEQGKVDHSKKYYIPTENLYTLFDGRFPFDKHEWLNQREWDVLFIQSIQQAIYLCIDSTVNMYTFKDEDALEMDVDSDDDVEDLSLHLKTLDKDWILSTREADLHMMRHHRHAFLLQRQTDFFGDVSYGAKFVHENVINFTTGQLNAEAVRAIWSSLAQELLFFTNNDDERYSVQSHPLLLRNITIHAAEPPLGYPIFNTIETIYPI